MKDFKDMTIDELEVEARNELETKMRVLGIDPTPVTLDFIINKLKAAADMAYEQGFLSSVAHTKEVMMYVGGILRPDLSSGELAVQIAQLVLAHATKKKTILH